MDDLNKNLCRAHEIFLENMSDETEAELDEILPGLVKAGYVKQYEHPSAGPVWAFTDAGVRRRKEMDCSDRFPPGAESEVGRDREP